MPSRKTDGRLSVSFGHPNRVQSLYEEKQVEDRGSLIDHMMKNLFSEIFNHRRAIYSSTKTHSAFSGPDASDVCHALTSASFRLRCVCI